MRQEQSIRIDLTAVAIGLIGPRFKRLAAGAALALALLPAAAHASPPAGGWISSTNQPFVRADWQAPRAVPPRFRNHCRYDHVRGRPYCANHCGPDYQFYFCSSESFGCCHPGYGYCDWKGHLRCAP